MKIKKAIIPTAGLGTRFLPITKAVPKSMLPIIDTPTIDYIIDEVLAAGIEEVIIITSHNTDVIESHFAANAELEQRLLADGKKELYEIALRTRNRIKVTFVKQSVLNGLAGAVLCAEEAVGGEPFALLLGDEIIYAAADDAPCIRQLCEVYEMTGKSVLGTMRVSDADVSKYGNLGISNDGSVMNVTKIVEKPSAAEKLSNYAIIGRYVMSPEIMGEIKKLKQKGSEILFTDALHALAAKNSLVAAEFSGIRYDVGDKFGYVRATVEYALRDTALGAQTHALVKELANKGR